MTEEQIKQNAKNFAINETGGLAIKYFPCEKGYIAGAHSRDEEVEELEQALAFTEDVVDAQKKELDQLRNPWISVEERLPEEGMSVVARNDYGDKGYNHCVCVFKGGKFVVIITNLTTGETQEIENNYVKAWMLIPQIEKGE